MICVLLCYYILRLEKSRSALEEKQELLGKLKMELTEMERDTENLLESMRYVTITICIRRHSHCFCSVRLPYAPGKLPVDTSIASIGAHLLDGG